MNWKSKLKRQAQRLIPRRVLNRVLLAFPSLYRTRLFEYETNLGKGIGELLAQLRLASELDGNVIECGSAYCGASVIMAGLLRSLRKAKVVYALDSFQGFDRAELAREKEAGLTSAPEKSYTSIPFDYVKRKIEKLGFENSVIPVKGYFRETLPSVPGGFCFALIDCDLKESIVYCMENIWPRLARGGRVVIDDYAHAGFKGARLGVDYVVDKYRNDISEHGFLKRLYYICKK